MRFCADGSLIVVVGGGGALFCRRPKKRRRASRFPHLLAFSPAAGCPLDSLRVRAFIQPSFTRIRREVDAVQARAYDNKQHDVELFVVVVGVGVGRPQPLFFPARARPQAASSFFLLCPPCFLSRSPLSWPLNQPHGGAPLLAVAGRALLCWASLGGARGAIWDDRRKCSSGVLPSFGFFWLNSFELCNGMFGFRGSGGAQRRRKIATRQFFGN